MTSYRNVYVYPFQQATEELKSQVWWKGTPIPGYDTRLWMYDKCGAVMYYPDHGNRDSNNGWEIDHIYPQARGGSDDLANLEPLNWKNNAAKSDSYPWSCPR